MSIIPSPKTMNRQSARACDHQSRPLRDWSASGSIRSWSAERIDFDLLQPPPARPLDLRLPQQIRTCTGIAFLFAVVSASPFPLLYQRVPRHPNRFTPYPSIIPRQLRNVMRPPSWDLGSGSAQIRNVTQMLVTVAEWQLTVKWRTRPWLINIRALPTFRVKQNSEE